MAIIMFGGQKGGSGKSTLSINLAVGLVQRDYDVVLVDTDLQGTASKWINRRNSLIEQHKIDYPIVHCVQRMGNVYKTVLDLAARYQYVIIDAGGSDNEAQRTGLTAANVLLLPFKPSQADLETLPYMCEVIELARAFNPNLVVIPVLSMAPTNPSIKETEEAKKVLAEFSKHIQPPKIIVKDRKVYRDSLLEGLGVLETNNNKAKEEIKLLLNTIVKVYK